MEVDDFIDLDFERGGRGLRVRVSLGLGFPMTAVPRREGGGGITGLVVVAVWSAT
jgi:hypothetical protein